MNDGRVDAMSLTATRENDTNRYKTLNCFITEVFLGEHW